MSQGIGQGIQKFNQNKAERKALLSFAKASTDMEKELGFITPEQASQRLDEFEGKGLDELRGWKDSVVVAESMRMLKERQAQREQQARLEERRIKLAEDAAEADKQQHQRKEDTINMANTLALGPQDETSFPVPPMDKLSSYLPQIGNAPPGAPPLHSGIRDSVPTRAGMFAGKPASRMPAPVTRKETDEELMNRAFEGAPNASIPDAVAAARGPQKSISEQLAIAKYKDDQNALTIEGIGMARTPSEAANLRTLKTSVESGIPKIRDLINIANTYSNITLNQDVRGKANVMHNQLVAELKETLVGSGAVSESEWDILYKTIRHPLKGWSDGSVVSSLQELERNLISKVDAAFRNNIMGYEPGSYSVPDSVGGEQGGGNPKVEKMKQRPPTKVTVDWSEMAD